MEEHPPFPIDATYASLCLNVGKRGHVQSVEVSFLFLYFKIMGQTTAKDDTMAFFSIQLFARNNSSGIIIAI